MSHKIIGALLLLLSFAAGWAWLDYRDAMTYPAVTGKPVIVEIEKGDSLDRIGKKLVAQRLAMKPFWFKAIAFLGETHKKIKTGEFELMPGMTVPEILDLLAQGKTKQYSITFPEGWNFKEIVQEIEKNPYLDHQLAKIDDTAFMEQLEAVITHPLSTGESRRRRDSTGVSVSASLQPAVIVPGPASDAAPTAKAVLAETALSGSAEPKSPEGMFFPDTYYFEKRMSDISLLKRAYHKMQSVLQQEWLNKAEGLPFKTPYEALILASIVEKETGNKAERPLIAGVFIRRLQKGMLLQTDPTVIYGMGDKFDGNISAADLTAATPYNTYVIKGLPPTPIAMPGKDAIYAALHPDSSDNLYFVARGDGTHEFSVTIKDHNRAVDTYQRKKRD